MIDPKSTAGVLLREHDTPWQAMEYAERKARFLLAMHNAIGLDYQKAAEQLRTVACPSCGLWRGCFACAAICGSKPANDEANRAAEGGPVERPVEGAACA